MVQITAGSQRVSETVTKQATRKKNNTFKDIQDVDVDIDLGAEQVAAWLLVPAASQLKSMDHITQGARLNTAASQFSWASCATCSL